MKQQLVRNWMTQDVMMIGPDTNLSELHGLMLQEHVRHLPVVHQQKLIGIISRGDMRSAVSLSLSDENRGMLNLTAEEIMTPDPVTIQETDTMYVAAQVMLQHKISGLPVKNKDGHIAGILTETDILQMVVQGWDKS